jgi:anti-sigma B factor antagonist
LAKGLHFSVSGNNPLKPKEEYVGTMVNTLSNNNEWFLQDKECTFTLQPTHLDYRNTPAIKQALVSAISEKAPNLILNLEHVDFMDSTGLGMLLFMKRHCDGLGGQISMTGLKPYVSNLVCITNLHRAIPILPMANVSS